MKLTLVLTSLCATALGAVHMKCYGFESPEESKYPSLKIQVHPIDTSVLVYHLKDLPHTNIPMTITDNVIMGEPNGFTICTQKRHSMGLCDGREAGQFIYTQTDDVDDQILNLVISSEGQATYEVMAPGIYCAVLYQEGRPSVKGVEISESHLYGDFPLAVWETMKVYLVVTFATVGACLYFRSVARQMRVSGVVEVVEFADTINSLLVLQLLLQGAKAIFGSIYFLTTNSTLLTGFMNMLDFSYNLYCIAIVLLYYKVSQGMMGKSLNIRAIEQKSFKYALATLVVTTWLILPLKALSSFEVLRILHILTSTATLFQSFAYLACYFIIWKNAKATQKSILSEAIARKYSQTRSAALWTPVIVYLTGMLALVAIGSSNLQMASSNQSNTLEKFFGDVTSTMDYMVSQNLYVLVLKHVPDFEMLVFTALLIYIWNPTVTASEEWRQVSANAGPSETQDINSMHSMDVEQNENESPVSLV